MTAKPIPQVWKIVNYANIFLINSILIHQQSTNIVTSFISTFEFYKSRDRRENNRGTDKNREGKIYIYIEREIEKDIIGPVLSRIKKFY